MEYSTDKGKEKGEYNADEMPTIRIILKSQETKNLEYVANTIVKLAKENRKADFYHESTAILGDYIPFVYMIMGTLILVFSALGYKSWISIVLMGVAVALHMFRVIKAFVEER